jgi:hypothetical protein
MATTGRRRARSTRQLEPNAGAYLGTVLRVTGAYAYVQLPRFDPSVEYGPAVYPSEYNPGTARPLAAGDTVVVAFIEGDHANIVVLARVGLEPGA